MAQKLTEIHTAYERGDVDIAFDMARQFLRRNRDDGQAWEALGLIHYARRDFRRSVSALERASLLVPLRPEARVCLGHGYGKLGRRELSRDLLAALIPDESLSIPLLLQVAAGLDSVDEPSLAMNACRKAWERDRHLAQPFYDMSYYSIRCGYPHEITESLARRAISLDPENVNYRVGLASVLMKRGREDAAYNLIEEFSNAQIESIACCRCLRRIIDLYLSARDFRRVIVCRQHCLLLEARGAGDRCA